MKDIHYFKHSKSTVVPKCGNFRYNCIAAYTEYWHPASLRSCQRQNYADG